MVDVQGPHAGRLIAGRYRIDEKIGSGGMGTVYRAHHELLERDVAIKFLNAELSHHPEYRERFLREARAANRIDHPHVIDVTDVGETRDGDVYIVMEFLRGRSLVDYVGQQMAPEHVIEIAWQTSDALTRAHELGIVHRDLKAENLHLLDVSDGVHVKLLDLGLAKIKGEMKMTATGSVLGTPEYISPEQTRGYGIGPKTDIYSLGVLMYELLAGTLPFEGNITALLLAHLRKEPPPLETRVAGIPKVLSQLVMSMLEKKSEDRPTAREVHKALERMREGDGPKKEQTTRELTLTEETALRWKKRVGLFRDLLSEVGGGVIAEPDRTQLALLEASSARLEAAASALREELTESEGATAADRSERRRLGIAIETLGTTLEKTRAQLERAPKARAQAQKRLVDMSPKLHRELEELTKEPDQQDALKRLAQLASEANTYLEAQSFLERFESYENDLKDKVEDLEFQVQALKGRFSAVSAGMEYDQKTSAAEAGSLEAAWHEALNEVARLADPIVARLMRDPHAHSVLREN